MVLSNYTIKPGLLVSLKTRVAGGISYQTSEEDEQREGRELTKTWRTEKHVEDVTEAEKAGEIRSRASALIRGTCIATPFGLLCPGDREEELNARVAEARELAKAHNASAKWTKVEIGILKGRIASDDEEAARAILSDVRESVQAMKAAIADVNVEGIRAAAQKARNLGQMLSGDQAAKVSAAVEAARKAAREIVRRVENGDELAEVVLRDISLKPIDDLRFSFLDTDEPGAMPAIDCPQDVQPLQEPKLPDLPLLGELAEARKEVA